MLLAQEVHSANHRGISRRTSPRRQHHSPFPVAPRGPELSWATLAVSGPPRTDRDTPASGPRLRAWRPGRASSPCEPPSRLGRGQGPQPPASTTGPEEVAGRSGRRVPAALNRSPGPGWPPERAQVCYLRASSPAPSRRPAPWRGPPDRPAPHRPAPAPPYRPAPPRLPPAPLPPWLLRRGQAPRPARPGCAHARAWGLRTEAVDRKSVV